MNMTVTVALIAAPAFIAGLIREGVCFCANQDGANMVIIFNGGY